MKHLLTALVVFCAVALGADTSAAAQTSAAGGMNAAGAKNAVPQCFKVHRLLKTDATHYWADWTNTCSFTIEAVYVMVGFRDRGRHEMGSGVWPMYFVKPGAHRVTRFSAPVAGFETVHVHRITTDSTLALKGNPGPVVAGKDEIPAVRKVGDTSVGKVMAAPLAAGPKPQPASVPQVPGGQQIAGN